MLVVGYYTPGPYEREADVLRATLDVHDIEHDFKAVPSRGSWQKNTQLKAEVVLGFIEKYGKRPFTYLDCDALVLQRPWVLEGFEIQGEVDVAAVKYGGHELLSGTVYFGGNPATREVVEKWIRFCEQYPDTFPGGLLPHFPRGDLAWDQRMLDLAIRCTVHCRFELLPPEYTFIYDISRRLHPKLKPVILHTAASRIYRDTVK